MTTISPARALRRRLGIFRRRLRSFAEGLRGPSLPSAWAISALLVLFGCSPPTPTFQEVLDGQIDMAPEDREALQKLLRVNGLDAKTLAILSPDSPATGTDFARLQNGRVVALQLLGVHHADLVSRLPHLRRLTLEGDLESLVLRDSPTLESLILYQGSEDSLGDLTLVGLPALENLVVNNADLTEGLHLEDLPALQDLALERCGLVRIPVLPASPVARLSLAGNEIIDLAPLAEMKSLVHLRLGDNGLSSLASLPPLPNLRALHLGHNPLTPDVSLAAADFPQLKTLDLRFTGLENVPPGLQDLPVKWDTEQTRRVDFQTTLASLRSAYEAKPGELVDRLGSTGGSLERSRGDCQWKTSTFSRAEVRCDLKIASLKGLAAARLGTTDPALPFQGGGTPRLKAELSVQEGQAALHVRESFDLVDMARLLSSVDEATAEEAREPGDRFDGYRRLLARPGSPAILEGAPSLLASSVVLWLEADGEARSLTLAVEPSD